MHHSIRICDVVTTEIEEGKKTSFIVNSGGDGGGGGNDSKDVDGDSRVRGTVSLIFSKGKESPKLVSWNQRLDSVHKELCDRLNNT